MMSQATKLHCVQAAAGWEFPHLQLIDPELAASFRVKTEPNFILI